MKSITPRLLLICSATLLAALLATFVYEPPASGASVNGDNFNTSRFKGGLTNPTSMVFAPDGRIFVTEQRGTLRVIKDGRLSTFKKLGGVDSRGERRLLGVELDPKFSENGYMYVYYTKKGSRSQNRIVRLTADGNQFKPGSFKTLFRLNKLSSAQNHNGGAIHFGKDGKLYAAVGDNKRDKDAQGLRNVFGKMLRLNPDGSIPRDNPFYGKARGKGKATWARGLRNPFSFAVQPGSGKIFINDVGQQEWEEINRGVARGNYGWPRYEGPESNKRFKPPIYAYRHDGRKSRTGCAITGGTFYNPQNVQFPSKFVGKYFFADFCNGWVRKLSPNSKKVSGFARGFSNPVDLDVGPDGNLYVLERGSGSIARIRHTG
ncbi:hypothetical protein BH24ACT22_BH24ACT22_05140 [soil metagenome]